MAAIASYSNKTNFISPPSVLLADALQFRVYGHLGAGLVQLLAQVSGGGYQKIAAITGASKDKFVELSLRAGDVVVVEFVGCAGASAELI